MAEFTLFWEDGKREIVKGGDITDAVNRAGYGGGAMAALDFYDHGDNKEYEYRNRQWHKKGPADRLFAVI